MFSKSLRRVQWRKFAYKRTPRELFCISHTGTLKQTRPFASPSKPIIDVCSSDDRFKSFPGVAITTCDLAVHPIHGDTVPTQASLPEGLYAIRGFYTWDTWVCDSRHVDGYLHRYTLSAPTMMNGQQVTPDDRHDIAFIRHALSSDGGKTWDDRGACIIPSKDEWPDLVVWSGSCVVREHEGKPQFAMFVTGRSEEDGLLQRIGICFSDDGHRFTQPHLILSPPENSEHGYDPTDEDGIIMAWRDPSLTFDPFDNTWHMFFSAKLRDPDTNEVKPAVGHAIPTNDDWTEWKLEPPMKLPYDYAQMEMPYIIVKDGHYYMFFSTQNKPLESTNHEKEARFRGYQSTSLLGPWDLCFCSSARCIFRGDTVFGSKVYAPTIFRTHDGEFGVTAFYSEHTQYPLTCTPVIDIEWQQASPLQPHIPLHELPGLEVQI